MICNYYLIDLIKLVFSLFVGKSLSMNHQKQFCNFQRHFLIYSFIFFNYLVKIIIILDKNINLILHQVLFYE
jgi:hypothetical protein